MPDELTLTYKKKILLYLDDHRHNDDVEILTVEVTQEGISEGVDMSRTHVSRILQGLKDEGLLDERTAHVKGRSRKLKTYTLTDKGINAAEKVKKEIENFEVTVIKGGEEDIVPLSEIEDETGICLIDAVILIESSGKLDLDAVGPKKQVKFLDEGPEVTHIFGRGDLLSKIDDWIQEETPVAVLHGTRGFGASSTARRFLDSIDDRHLLWLSIGGKSKEDVENIFKEFSVALGCEPEYDLFQCLKKQHGLIIVDNYYDVNDEIVDIFSDLVDALKLKDNLKVVFTVREGTPVYERFYHKEHIDKGIVKELKVPPLKCDDAKKLLGVDIDPEAFKRIMQMTKGSPLLLKLLKEDDNEGMKKASPLTKGQISLLMFLKTQEVDS